MQCFSAPRFVHYVRFLSVSADKCVGNLWFCAPFFGILANEIMPIDQWLEQNITISSFEETHLSAIITAIPMTPTVILPRSGAEAAPSIPRRSNIRMNMTPPISLSERTFATVPATQTTPLIPMNTMLGAISWARRSTLIQPILSALLWRPLLMATMTASGAIVLPRSTIRPSLTTPWATPRAIWARRSPGKASS